MKLFVGQKKIVAINYFVAKQRKSDAIMDILDIQLWWRLWNELTNEVSFKWFIR